ncbi:MAG: lysophospholipid acyltransferase family protein [Candidatus Aminicenantales bacterium]
MSVLRKLRWSLIGVIGKGILWFWGKSLRLTVKGEEAYRRLRALGKPVIFLVWHGKIFIVPFFFRRRGIMPLISPSEDGEIAAQIMARWGYKILRGSGSHSIIKAWNEMKREIEEGGELIIVPDGPSGPDRKMKPGALKLAQETGAYLVPFTFSSARRKVLSSWDHFWIPRPFSRVVAAYGNPITVPPDLTDEAFDRMLQSVEEEFVRFDAEADRYFEEKKS